MGIEVQGPVQGLEFRIALVVVGVVEHAVLLINKNKLEVISMNKLVSVLVVELCE